MICYHTLMKILLELHFPNFKYKQKEIGKVELNNHSEYQKSILILDLIVINGTVFPGII